MSICRPNWTPLSPIDLFGLVCLLPHFKPCDVTLENSVFLMKEYILAQTKEQFWPILWRTNKVKLLHRGHQKTIGRTHCHCESENPVVIIVESCFEKLNFQAMFRSSDNKWVNFLLWSQTISFYFSATVAESKHRTHINRFRRNLNLYFLARVTVFGNWRQRVAETSQTSWLHVTSKCPIPFCAIIFRDSLPHT